MEREADNFFVNSNKGDIIGPGKLAPLSSLEAINGLIEIQDKTFQYRWFKSSGLNNSLQVKLKAALDSARKKNWNAANNQLRAYLNEVNAQRGKGLGNTTADLFEANINYIEMLLAESR
jgi:hypothetical protein